MSLRRWARFAKMLKAFQSERWVRFVEMHAIETADRELAARKRIALVEVDQRKPLREVLRPPGVHRRQQHTAWYSPAFVCSAHLDLLDSDAVIHDNDASGGIRPWGGSAINDVPMLR